MLQQTPLPAVFLYYSKSVRLHDPTSHTAPHNISYPIRSQGSSSKYICRSLQSNALCCPHENRSVYTREQKVSALSWKNNNTWKTAGAHFNCSGGGHHAADLKRIALQKEDQAVSSVLRHQETALLSHFGH